MKRLRRALGSKEVCGNCGEWRFLCGCEWECEAEWGDEE